jgi:hypothetical protein
MLTLVSFLTLSSVDSPVRGRIVAAFGKAAAHSPSSPGKVVPGTPRLPIKSSGALAATPGGKACAIQRAAEISNKFRP